MTARSCSADTYAAMKRLVRLHVPSEVRRILTQRDSSDVPSVTAIKVARADFLRTAPEERRRVIERRAPVSPPEAQAPCPSRAQAKPTRAALTFEEKLARVAAGAQLVTVRPISKSYADRTLGGIASAML